MGMDLGVSSGLGINTIGQYIVISWDIEHFPELDFEGTSHAFWCYLLVPQPEIYI